MSDVQPPKPVRQSSLDPEAMKQLQKRLEQRPEKTELVERNILKDDNGLAPSLIAAQQRLQRSQLEDKLEHALQQRPKVEQLVEDRILQDNEVPPM